MRIPADITAEILHQPLGVRSHLLLAGRDEIVRTRDRNLSPGMACIDSRTIFVGDCLGSGAVRLETPRTEMGSDASTRVGHVGPNVRRIVSSQLTLAVVLLVVEEQPGAPSGHQIDSQRKITFATLAIARLRALPGRKVAAHAPDGVLDVAVKARAQDRRPCNARA